jgi:hypothetical protein
MDLGVGVLLVTGLPVVRLRFSCSMIEVHSSTHSPQMNTSDGPSTSGPTSR